MLICVLLEGNAMNRFALMTALALVLAAPSAHAEYTGNGAISAGPSAPIASLPQQSGTATSSSTDLKSSAKEKWDNFKNSHEDAWEKLEAARRAHWHGISMHVGKGKASAPDTTPASAGMTADPDTGEQAEVSGDTQASVDTGKRPSRWESFKENHAEGMTDAKEHAHGVKEHLESGKEKVKDAASHWEENHQDKVAAVKDKVEDFKDRHQDAIDSAKDKWHAWRDKHSGSQ